MDANSRIQIWLQKAFDRIVYLSIYAVQIRIWMDLWAFGKIHRVL